LLRQELDIIRKSGIKGHILAKDMAKFHPKKIHDYLAKAQVLPECKRLKT
jgi:hypothetical protein